MKIKNVRIAGVKTTVEKGWDDVFVFQGVIPFKDRNVEFTLRARVKSDEIHPSGLETSYVKNIGGMTVRSKLSKNSREHLLSILAPDVCKALKEQGKYWIRKADLESIKGQIEHALKQIKYYRNDLKEKRQKYIGLKKSPVLEVRKEMPF